jgi:CHAT domain-containing protein
MLKNYEPSYTRFLQECKIEDALEFFQREKSKYQAPANYISYTKPAIYWCRCNLLLSNYAAVQGECDKIARQEWFKFLPTLLQARLQLIQAKLDYAYGDYVEADLKTDKLLEVIQVESPSLLHTPDYDFFFCRTYLLKAKIQWRKRDTFQAKLYLALSLVSYLDAKPPADHHLTGRLYSHYGQIFLHEGEAELAMKYFELSQKFYDKHGRKQHFYHSDIRGQLSDSLIALRLHAKAREEIDNALKHLDEVFKNPMHRNRCHLLYLKARSYILEVEEGGLSPKQVRRNLVDAYLCLNKELEIREELFPKNYHLTLSRLWNNISRIYCLRKEWNSAIEAAYDALRANFQDYEAVAGQLATERAIVASNSSYELLLSLQRLTEAYWSWFQHAEVKNEADLKKAWKYAQDAQQIVNLIRERYFTQESKMGWGATARVIFELGLRILMERKRILGKLPKDESDRQIILQEAFDLFCNSKSYILVQSLHPSSVSALSSRIGNGLPITASQWSELLKDIDKSFASDFRQVSINLERVRKILKVIRRNRPKRRVKLDTGLPLSKVHAALTQSGDPGTIISYFLGQKHLFALVIRGDKDVNYLQFECLIDTEEEIQELEAQIIQLGDTFNKFDQDNVHDEVLKHIPLWDAEEKDVSPGEVLKNPNWLLYNRSQQFYRKLIKPLSLPAEGRLYIIPDGKLFNVPFPFLSRPYGGKQGCLFSRLPYLALHYKITYHISIALLYRNHEPQSKSLYPGRDEECKRLTLLSIAGSERQGQAYLAKPMGAFNYAIAEIANAFRVAEEHHIELSRLKEIDKKVVKECAERQLIIHFFGHSYAREEYSHSPALLLDRDLENAQDCLLLTQEEIVHYQLEHNYLVLINACRVGDGKMRNGESPLSIHRAFLRAGARNIYYAMFQIEQIAARDFTVHFAEELMLGHNFATAMQNTQYHFIRSKSRLSHPAMWASASFIGNQVLRIFPLTGEPPIYRQKEEEE